MTVTAGGSASSADLYGVDESWFDGSAWSLPIFDGGGAPHEISRFMDVVADYVVIDRLEMRNFYWNVGGFGTSFIELNAQNDVLVKGCSFHDWTHSATAPDDLIVVKGTTTPGNVGCVVDRCLFDGASSGGNSGAAVQYVPTVTNSTIRNVAFGVGPRDNGEVSWNVIGPVQTSYAGGAGIAIVPKGPASQMRIHHNFIANVSSYSVWVGNPGTAAYVYDNVLHDSGRVPIEVDCRGGASSLSVYNNTVISTGLGAAVECVGPNPWTLVAQDNQFIDGAIGSGFSTVTQDHNLTQTLSDANLAGYTLANGFAPTSEASPTVNAGVSLSADYASDILGVVRPQGGAWDIGAYER
jgi:hypothetical protein